MVTDGHLVHGFTLVLMAYFFWQGHTMVKKKSQLFTGHISDVIIDGFTFPYWTFEVKEPLVHIFVLEFIIQLGIGFF